MNPNEWCAIVHVDFRPSFADREEFIARLRAGVGPTFEAGEKVLRDLVAGADHSAGTIEVAVLQQQRAANHFEVVSRFASEAAYEAHLATPLNVEYRRGIASDLGSPYEDRLHSARGSQSWPRATVGDAVVLTQIEVQQPHLDQALSIVDEIAAAQSANAAMRGEVLLQRHYRPTNLELISVWSSSEAFDEHIASSAVQSSRSALSSLLVAPIDDRRHDLFAGEWSTP
jgi:quinol monooxygenase YgiN